MNTTVLNNYKIDFQFLSNINEAIVKQTILTDLGYLISIFLIEHPYVNYLNNEIIPQINNALNNGTIDDFQRGDSVILTIGKTNSNFTYTGISTKNVSIPTIDLKEIILSWIEFLTNHGIIK
ncbi:hypothetical protein BBH99_04020 [Chryseobacterium contaminans]|uniref:Uncharacterized protein n=1 Tax=Chryseobacterium contaminans TaxID=1423959 RepID=A0A1M7A197_9FLAO|nr:hypothetical protein [Chryseobacterium contaminans]OCA80500.1 hypothetical protein BBH99_04020 [Chryseobacterium contaminans]SHL36389.1 hypothetical protein SAMN05444407_103444 [Chryseobacterium contaminans]